MVIQKNRERVLFPLSAGSCEKITEHLHIQGVPRFLLELLGGFEPPTSSLPRTRSTN